LCLLMLVDEQLVSNLPVLPLPPRPEDTIGDVEECDDDDDDDYMGSGDGEDDADDVEAPSGFTQRQQSRANKAADSARFSKLLEACELDMDELVGGDAGKAARHSGCKGSSTKGNNSKDNSSTAKTPANSSAAKTPLTGSKTNAERSPEDEQPSKRANTGADQQSNYAQKENWKVSNMLNGLGSVLERNTEQQMRHMQAMHAQASANDEMKFRALGEGFAQAFATIMMRAGGMGYMGAGMSGSMGGSMGGGMGGSMGGSMGMSGGMGGGLSGGVGGSMSGGMGGSMGGGMGGGMSGGMGGSMGVGMGGGMSGGMGGGMGGGMSGGMGGGMSGGMGGGMSGGMGGTMGRGMSGGMGGGMSGADEPNRSPPVEEVEKAAA
jgi:hypothetical protein